VTNVYLAGPFFDDEQISRIERAEKALAANPQVNRVFSPRLSEIAGLTTMCLKKNVDRCISLFI